MGLLKTKIHQLETSEEGRFGIGQDSWREGGAWMGPRHQSSLPLSTRHGRTGDPKMGGSDSNTPTSTGMWRSLCALPSPEKQPQGSQPRNLSAFKSSWLTGEAKVFLDGLHEVTNQVDQFPHALHLQSSWRRTPRGRSQSSCCSFLL